MLTSLQIIKPCKTIQLAHLYEHIFCTHIDNYFRSKAKYSYLDYRLIGKTYHGGMVYIEIEFYNKATNHLAKTIENIVPDFSEDNIYTAINQIMAEIDQPFGGKGVDAIQKALNDLQSVPWRVLDDLSFVDAKAVRKIPGPFYIAEGKSNRKRKLQLSLSIDSTIYKDRPLLLPLYRQICRLINSNLQSLLSDSYGYFSFEDSFTTGRTKTTHTNIFKLVGYRAGLEDHLRLASELISDMYSNGAFDRFMNDLQTTSYRQTPLLAPNFESNYENTLIFIGGKGWRETANGRNCRYLLENMLIEVKLGRQKDSRPLKDIL